jgi:DNA phosphorothioation-dependent restriction protein DptG
MTNTKTTKKSSQNRSLYTTEEDKHLRQFLVDKKKKFTSSNYDKIQKLMKLCEDRKNRIRYNKVIEEDKKSGFTPKNFPYLTQFSEKYYPKKYWLELQELNK